MTRVEYYWVPESRRVTMPVKPKRIQTVLRVTTPNYTVDGLESDVKPAFPFDGKPGMEPAHNFDVFYEDFGHDWNWKNGELRYYSRAIEHSVWIRCEFGEEP